jgi:UDP-3-O-[3-hydroxymyristoyl] glucosamine N-acyltransferase
VPHDVPPGATFSGYPAVERALWLRQSAALKQLPELLREVRELRARLAALESRKDESE